MATFAHAEREQDTRRVMDEIVDKVAKDAGLTVEG